MESVKSKDSTVITYDKMGSGDPVILVSGGSVDKSSLAGLADLLQKDFTVYNYDRRGRGASGDTAPYAVQREIEDIDAVIQAAGGSAFLFGSSSGAALAMEVAAAGLSLKKLALWEPPYIVSEGRPRPPADTAKTFSDLVAAGRRGDAVEHFMVNVVGLPPEFAAGARTQPWWPYQEALAHTLAYDATIMADYNIPTQRAASVKVPTLVLAGGGDFPWMVETAQALVKVIPGAQFRQLHGQTHNVDMNVLAPALVEFFKA